MSITLLSSTSFWKKFSIHISSFRFLKFTTNTTSLITTFYISMLVLITTFTLSWSLWFISIELLPSMWCLKIQTLKFFPGSLPSPFFIWPMTTTFRSTLLKTFLILINTSNTIIILMSCSPKFQKFYSLFLFLILFLNIMWLSRKST